MGVGLGLGLTWWQAEDCAIFPDAPMILSISLTMPMVEHFRRMAQVNPKFPRDYPKQFITYLIFVKKEKANLMWSMPTNIRK